MVTIVGVKVQMDYEVEGVVARGRPEITWEMVVDEDLCKKDAVF